MAQQQVSADSKILRAVPLHDQPKESRHRGFRPRSPVKLLSNILGASASQPATPLKPRPHVSTIGSLPVLPVSAGSGDFVPLGRDEKNVSTGSKVTLVDSNDVTLKNPLTLLEDTFAAYIVALRSRSGNVVGKVLQARASTNELIVNELYNTLLDDPTRLEAAAIVSVDVLFAAFEKFLRRAWRERMGPLVPPSIIKDMQSNVDAGSPTIFAQHFKHSLEEMSPQNRRAFATTVKLLSDLLDASGNDGDRGVLIASFAEALILVGNSHDYIILLDRLVDDYDSLFDDVGAPDAQGGGTTSATSSLGRNRSFNTGSLSSNASSLRKKLGRVGGLSRENSKNESESKVGSIWRTWSKNTKTPGDGYQPASLSNVALVRSRSTDTDTRTVAPSRHLSRDRPPTSGSSNSDGSYSRPGSSHLNTSGLSSIGEDTTSKTTHLPPKKKRRSSLSDLQSLRAPDLAGMIAPLKPRKVDENCSSKPHPRTMTSSRSPSKQVYEPQLERLPPQRSGIPRFGSPKTKENSPLRDQPLAQENSTVVLRSAAKPINKPTPHPIAITSSTQHVRKTSKSGIPAPRVGLSERAGFANVHTSSSAVPKSPPKMRVQSPQKLRQRLSQEQRTISIAEAGLQAEMGKIGGELSKQAHTIKGPQTDMQSLKLRLNSLEAQLKGFMIDCTAKNTSLRSDFEASVLVSSKKARKLDELYKEANAENEALYDRFNDELGKVLSRVRRGEGAEEVKAKLGEAQSEVRRLKGENAKLKREVVLLKSAMNGE
ncbi:MAG: hypothetical protein Q9163_001106 [Psora crenata]